MLINMGFFKNEHFWESAGRCPDAGEENRQESPSLTWYYLSILPPGSGNSAVDLTIWPDC